MLNPAKLTASIAAALAIAAANFCACASHYAAGAVPMAAAPAAHEGQHESGHHGGHGGDPHGAASEDHHREGPCAGDCEHERGEARASAPAKPFFSAPLASAAAPVTEFSAASALYARAVAADFMPPTWRGPPGATLVSLKVRLQN